VEFFHNEDNSALRYPYAAQFFFSGQRLARDEEVNRGMGIRAANRKGRSETSADDLSLFNLRMKLNHFSWIKKK
jgi:hypothetical protein